MADPTVDFYKALEIDPKATQQQIRDAYKKAALKHHPDRVPTDSPERAKRTKKFQEINAAYYTLSDPTRRRQYDVSRPDPSTAGSSSSTFEEEMGGGPSSSGNGGFPWSSFGFGRGSSANNDDNESETSFEDEQFGSAFEEMLREEGMAENGGRPNGKFWSFVGALSGGAMGFIVANFPGAIAGTVAGNRLGAIRDAKGKSVYSVFQELPQADKARLLSELAAKVFSHAVSG